MGRKKKTDIKFEPRKPKWNMKRLDELTNAIQDVLDIMDDIRDTDFTTWEALRYGGEPYNCDYVSSLDWWLEEIGFIRETSEMAQFLAQYYSTDTPLTVEDIDDDIEQELRKFFHMQGFTDSITGQHYGVGINWENVIDYFNTYLVGR